LRRGRTVRIIATVNFGFLTIGFYLKVSWVITSTQPSHPFVGRRNDYWLSAKAV